MKQRPLISSILSIESQFVLWAASVTDDKDRKSRFHDILEMPLNWDFVLRESMHHDMSSLFYRQISKLGLSHVPEAVVGEFKKYYTYTMGRNMLMAQILINLIRLFCSASIPFLPYKGLMLAKDLYDDIACRRMGDIDVLVREIDVERSKSLLLEHGYIPAKDMNRREIKKLRKQDCEESFYSPKHRVLIELHWRLMPPVTTRAADCEDMWDHVREDSYFGEKTFSLEPEWNALVIFLHAGIKHRWSEIKLIADAARIIQKYENMDWNVIMRQAAIRKEEVQVLLGVYLAHSLLEVNFPSVLVSWIKRFPQVRAFAGLVMGRLFRKDHGLPGFREWRRYIRALQNINLFDERKWFPLEEFCRYSIAVLTPEYKDKYKLVKLSKALSFLHFFVRPLRLSAQHGIDLMNRIK